MASPTVWTLSARSGRRATPTLRLCPYGVKRTHLPLPSKCPRLDLVVRLFGASRSRQHYLVRAQSTRIASSPWYPSSHARSVDPRDADSVASNPTTPVAGWRYGNQSQVAILPMSLRSVPGPGKTFRGGEGRLLWAVWLGRAHKETAYLEGAARLKPS
ncbi:hypothetical protein LX36DRAFT_30139 [Colletotrichum falcatum]|nr:hypothetical protein LX36DRAFT_30139 [Colletotrichum falcatum]